jgi:hypothetical protein
MEYKFIKDSVDLLKAVDDFDERDFRGCSDTQIESLEELLPEYVYLPESYYEFLRFGGHGICDMLNGTNFYFSQVFGLRAERKPQILKDMGFFSENFDDKSYLTDELFLFYYHQGYFARFFYLDAGSDPNIFYYETGLPHDFLLTQEQSFSQYLYTEVASFVAQYQEEITNVDIELRNRVKRYRHGLLDMLDVLESLPASTGTKLTQDANRRYSEILRNTSRLLFNYPYYKLYEYEYVFSPKNYSNSQEEEAGKSQELLEMMYGLEKEGEGLISYVRELKSQNT